MTTFRKKEKEHDATFLNICGYPSWIVDNVKQGSGEIMEEQNKESIGSER